MLASNDIVTVTTAECLADIKTLRLPILSYPVT